MWSLVAFALVAPPPLGDFPAVVAPTNGSTAPANASVFALGDPAPTPDQVGVVLTIDGAAGPALSFEQLGCCALIATPAAAFVEGASVVATITSAAGDVNTSFTVGPADDERPTFASDPAAIDHGPSDDGTAYEIVIGVDATDDTAAVLLIAEHDGAVVGTSADGFILRARVPGALQPGELCVDVSAMDVAMNLAIPALAVCVTVEGEDPAEGEGEGEDPAAPGGCACSSSSAALLPAAWLLRGLRRRPSLCRARGP